MRNLQYSRMRLSLPVKAALPTPSPAHCSSTRFVYFHSDTETFMCAYGCVAVQWHGLMLTSTNVQFSKCMPKVFSNQLLSPFLFLSVLFYFAFFSSIYSAFTDTPHTYTYIYLSIWLAICQGKILLLKNLYARAFK